MTKNRDISKILDQATTFAVSVNVGANVIANTTVVGVGGNTINSTVWTGKALTANDASYLGGTAAADYQTEAGLSANVATLTANNANYVKANTGLVSNSSGVFVNSAYIGTLSANNASYLGGTAAADYQTEAGLAANVAILTANNANNLGGLAASGYANLSVATFTTSVNVGANVQLDTSKLTIGGNTVNSTIFTGKALTANNADYLGGTAASSYALDTDLDAYQTEAGLAANVAILTANNANNLGGLSAANYANLSVATFTTSVNVGANVGLTTSQIKLANSTANTTLVPGSVNISGAEGVVEVGDFAADMDTSTDQGIKFSGSGRLPAGAFTEVTGNILSYGINVPQVGTRTDSIVGGIFRLDTRPSTEGFNVLGYATGGNAGVDLLSISLQTGAAKFGNSVNATAFTTTGFRANTTYVVPTSNSSGQNLGNTISRWVIIGNTVTVSGGVYPDSNTVGTALGSGTQRWVLNANTITTSGLASLDSLNVTNRTNTATFYATTSANVGANITISTASVLVSNGGATFVNVTATGITLANTTNTVTIIPPTTAQKGGNYYLKADGVWTEVVAGATPGGSNTYVQYNDSTALGGSAGFIFNETTNNVTIANTLSVGANVIVNTSEVRIGNDVVNGVASSISLVLANSTTSASMGPGSLIVGNSSVNTTLNSTSFTGTANNASYLGGTAAANYALDTDLDAYQTEAGLSANVATLTANNTNYLGGNIVANSTGAYPISNTSGAVLGNTISRFILTGNSVTLSGDVSAAQHTSTNFAANSSGIYHTSTINAAAFTTTGFRANTTYVVPTSNSSGHFFGNTISRWVIVANSVSLTGDVSAAQLTTTNFAANSSGVYHSTVMNTATFSVGTSYTANSTVVNAAAVNCRGQVNTVTSYATTSANVGANVQANTTAFLVGNSTVNTVITSTLIKLANSTVNTSIAVPTSAQYGGNYFLHANGTWAEVTATGNDTVRIYQSWIANDSVNTTFACDQTYTASQVDIFYNGAHLPITEFTASNGTHIQLNEAAQLGAVVEMLAFGNVNISTFELSAAGSNTQVQFNDSAAANGSVGFTFNKTTNTVSIGTATINSTVYSQTANNASYLGGLAAASYANLSVATFTTSVNVGANVIANTTTIRIGNTAVNTTIGNNIIYVGNSTSNVTVNSSMISIGSSNVALLNTEDQMVTGGAGITIKDLGNSGTGTVTPDPRDRPHQKYTNNGAHTLAPGSNYGAYLLDVTNASSAQGAITTSGWTKVAGDAFSTVGGAKWRCHASVTSDYSLLIVQALQ